MKQLHLYGLASLYPWLSISSSPDLFSSISVLVLSSLRSSVFFNISISFMNNLAGLDLLPFLEREQVVSLERDCFNRFQESLSYKSFLSKQPMSLVFQSLLD